jgi:hypothetical protein
VVTWNTFGLKTGLELRACKPNVPGASLNQNLKKKSRITMNWQGPIRLFKDDGTKAALPRTVPHSPGAYRVRVLREDGQPEPMHRLNRDDPDGILHIGTALYVRSRIMEFQRSAIRNSATARVRGGHNAGCNFSIYRYAQKFPLGTLYVDYCLQPTVDNADALEYRLHEDYQVRFLDRPPLDASAGRLSRGQVRQVP